MLKTPTFIVLSLAFYIAGTATLSAQNPPSNLGQPSRVTIAETQNFKVTAELQRQEKFLQGIAARYEEVSTYDLTPLLKYPYVWNALRENRTNVTLPKKHLTASQSRLFLKAYDLLEEETLMSFLDHQLSLLTETLDLEEDQQGEMQKILTMDLSNKRTLLTAPLDAKNFQRRLDKISETTEKQILAILYPIQRRMFDRQEMFNRNRMVG